MSHLDKPLSRILHNLLSRLSFCVPPTAGITSSGGGWLRCIYTLHICTLCCYTVCLKTETFSAELLAWWGAGLCCLVVVDIQTLRRWRLKSRPQLDQQRNTKLFCCSTFHVLILKSPWPTATACVTLELKPANDVTDMTCIVWLIITSHDYALHEKQLFLMCFSTPHIFFEYFYFKKCIFAQ